MDFLEKFDKVVYISFGSINNPNYQKTAKIIESIRASSKLYDRVGYVFALRQSHPAFEYLVQTSEEVNNLIATSWAPQRALFNHPKVETFISHCGANGVVEAQYFGLKIIGMPITDE